MHKSVGVLGDCVSICERIYNTPIPLAYSRHTSRFLVIYVSTLPLVLVGALRWATLPVMVTVCWALFGILEIGNLVEEPFTAVVGSTSASTHHLLPLTEVCRTIRRDVRSIAQYTLIGKNYSVPTIQQYPRVVGMPDNFKVSRPTTRSPRPAPAATAACALAPSPCPLPPRSESRPCLLSRAVPLALTCLNPTRPPTCPHHPKTLRELASNSTKRGGGNATSLQNASSGNASKKKLEVPPATPFMTGAFLDQRR